METVVDALAAAGRQSLRGHTFVRADGGERHVPFAQLHEEARAIGAGLRSLGLNKGDRVALVLPDPEQFVLTFLGAMCVGLVPVPLYPPASMTKLDSYAATLAHVLRAAGASILVAPHAQLELLNDLLKVNAPGIRTLDAEAVPRASFGPELEAEKVLPDDLALLQFTSGSTSAPKGVMITHGQLAANGKAIMIDGLASGETDIGVSWLPLYHDMGLIGFVVAPLFTKVAVVFLPTSMFIRRPASWLQAIHKYRGTITFAPNFAYALAARSIQDRHLANWDLSSLRVAGCGAEPIQPEVMRAFIEKFSPVGFEPKSLLPAYGMAEATLAVTFAPLARDLVTDYVDGTALKQGRADRAKVNGHVPAGTVELVGCGRALRRFEVQVRDEAGKVAPDRMVGEIFVRGPSVASGYWGQPEISAQTFGDGWLRTGDLGYMVGGELFVSGRKKDLIILNGRNYSPQDIEAIVFEVDGVRFGQAAAFTRRMGARNDESLVIVAETNRSNDRHDELRAAIAARVFDAIGLVVAETVLIRAGTLPKTSSGKVRRSETKNRLETSQLELADRPAASAIEATPSASAHVAKVNEVEDGI